MGPLIGVHHVLTILAVGEGLPCGIMERVAFPLDEVLGSGAMEALLQKGLHFILGFTIDDEGRGEGVKSPAIISEVRWKQIVWLRVRLGGVGISQLAGSK